MIRGGWIACLLLVCASGALAQAKKVELSFYAGHQFGAVVDETTKDEGVDSLATALGVHGSGAFGLIFNYHMTRTFHLEITWDEQPTQLDFIDRAADSTYKVTDLRVHYYQVGFVYNWSDSKRQPFVGLTMGVAKWEARGDFEDETGFCFSPVVGYKTWMSDYFGLRVHLRFLLTNVPSGELFSSASTGFSHTHTKDTWATQIQLAVAVTLGK
jgi:hypothetical protein